MRSKKAEGSLRWLVDRKLAKDKGSVYYKLVDMPILYITPDGDKVDISTLSQAYSLRMC